MTKKGKVKYKKAPQAPRRFKSAYMFFSTEKHKEIREKLGEKGESEKTTTIAKLVSQAWKDLTPQEREPWDEMARKDKERFEVEKTLYTGPWKVPAKKSQKNPNAPKRPMSAFLSYSHAKRAEVKKKHPSMNNAEISRLLAQMWKDATEEEKKQFIDQEYELRQKYLTDIAQWRETTEKEISEQRKHREEIAMKTLEARKNGSAEPSMAEAGYGVSGPESQGGSGGGGSGGGGVAASAGYFGSGAPAPNYFPSHGYASSHDPYQHAYGHPQYMHPSYAQSQMSASGSPAPNDAAAQPNQPLSDGYHHDYSGGGGPYGGYYGPPPSYPPMRQDMGGGGYGRENPLPHPYYGSDGYGGHHPPPGYPPLSHGGYYDHYHNPPPPNDYGAAQFNPLPGAGDHLSAANNALGGDETNTPLRIKGEGSRIDTDLSEDG